MTDIKQQGILVQELAELITKGNAHASFEDAVNDIPLQQLTNTPDLLPYNIWQLVEHIRIAQWDILEFCLDPKHKSPKWPDEYWVRADEDVTKEKWDASLSQISDDKNKFLNLLQDPTTDLYTALPQGSGQNILREALLIADHNSYHVGEIIIIRRLLRIWK
jgi:hypothetical protein